MPWCACSSNTSKSIASFISSFDNRNGCSIFFSFIEVRQSRKQEKKWWDRVITYAACTSFPISDSRAPLDIIGFAIRSLSSFCQRSNLSCGSRSSSRRVSMSQPKTIISSLGVPSSNNLFSCHITQKIYFIIATTFCQYNYSKLSLLNKNCNQNSYEWTIEWWINSD